MIDDFNDCVLMNTVMAARVLSRRYDTRLRPFGVTVAQFSTMTIVRNKPNAPVSTMAQHIAMDRTTLLRNLGLLERKNLVSAQPAVGRNGRTFSLTMEGDALLDRLIPEWRRAQAELGALLADYNRDDMLGALRRLTDG